MMKMYGTLNDYPTPVTKKSNQNADDVNTPLGMCLEGTTAELFMSGSMGDTAQVNGTGKSEMQAPKGANNF